MNLINSLNSPQVMKEHKVHNLVFSSSATVYGSPQYLPLDEKHPVGGCTNPYGKTKFFIEEMLRDLVKAEKVIGIVMLLCFLTLYHQSVIKHGKI